MDILGVAKKILFTPAPSPFGCSAPPDSCLNKEGAPTFGQTKRVPDTYDYSDPNRGPVTYYIYANNCDGSPDGMTATADFAAEGGKVTVPFHKDQDGNNAAVITHTFNSGSGGNIPLTITGKNGVIFSTYLYPPTPATATPVTHGPCYYNQGNPSLSGAIEMEPKQPVAGQPVTFSYKKHNIIQCDGKTYGDDPASAVKAYIITDLSEPDAQAAGATSDQNGVISRAVTFPKGFAAPVYVKVIDPAQENSTPQLLAAFSPNSVYVTDNSACQNSGQSAALTAAASTGSIIRGADTAVTYTAAVHDSCNQPVTIDYAKLDQFFLPGYTKNYDLNSLTLTVTGIVRDDLSLPVPVEIPYTDSTGTASGVISFYPPVRTTPSLIVPPDGSIHIQEEFVVLLDKPPSGAAVKVTVTDKLDGGSVLSSFDGASGLLRVAQSGVYFVKATVTPAGDLPYDLEPVKITAYQQSTCQNGGQPIALAAARSLDTITRGTSAPVTFTATAVHDSCNQPVVFDAAKLDEKLAQLFLPGYKFNYDKTNMTVTVTGVIKNTLPLPSPVEIPFTDAAGAAAGTIKFYPPAVNSPKIVLPSSPVHTGETFVVSISPEMTDADARLTLTDRNGNQLADPVEAFSASFAAEQSGTFKIKATITPRNGDAPYELSDEITVYDSACTNNSQLGTLTAARSAETIVRGANTTVAYTATGVHDSCGQPVVFDAAKLDEKLAQLFLPGYEFNYDMTNMTVTVTGMIRDGASLPNPLELPFSDQAGKATGAINFYPPTRLTPVIKAPADPLYINQAFTVFTEPAIDSGDAAIVLNVIDPNDPGKVPLATLGSSSGQFTIAKSGNYKITGTVTPANGDIPYDLEGVNITIYDNTCKNSSQLGTLTAARSADTIARGANTPVTYTATGVHDSCNQPVTIDYPRLDQLFLPGYAYAYEESAMTFTVTGVIRDSVSLPSPLEIPFTDRAGTATGAIALYPPTVITPKIVTPAGALYVEQVFTLSINPVVAGAAPLLSITDLAGNEISSLDVFSGNFIIHQSGNFKVTGKISPANDSPYDLAPVNITVYDNTCKNNGQLVSLTASRSADTIVRGTNSPVTYTATAVHDSCNQAVVFDPADLAKFNQLFLSGYAQPAYNTTEMTFNVSGVVRAAQTLPNPLELPFKDQAGAAAGTISFYPPARTMPKIIVPTSPLYVGQAFAISIDPAVAGASPLLSVLELSGDELASFTNFSNNYLSLPYSGTFKATGSIKPQSDDPYDLDLVYLSTYGSPPAVESFVLSPDGCTRGAPQSETDPIQTCAAPFIVNFKLRAASTLGLAGIKINFGDGPDVNYDPADLFDAAANAYLFSHEFATANAATYNVTGSVTDINNQSAPIPSKPVTIY
ncbi:MAG: hypothetical protein JW873_06415 [Candidatus Saganbacteria bacterium]|nr:hypothetical protein [Candidatus Saganbacteria bacterium]